MIGAVIFILIYFIGWAFGFMTCTFLVWHLVAKAEDQKKSLAAVRTKDLYPDRLNK